MTPPNQGPSGGDHPAPRFLPLLLLLFVGSGCAALIYEIVWFQLLQLVIGSSAISLGVLLGTYMGGMCLGALLLPRVVSPGRHPLRVYAVIETGIGLLGIAVLSALPWVSRLYVSNAPQGPGDIFLRGALCGVCLLPPTFLMGATLPAISRWVKANPRGISWLGFFYGGNIAGAVFGCLFAGFYLLRLHDMQTATWVAAAINGTVASIAFALSIDGTSRPESPVAAPDATADPAGAGFVYVTIALSGLCALGSEVIWTRLLSLLLGPTVYTFSIILAVFLVGLGLGSSAGAAVGRGMRRPAVALGLCQLLLMGGMAWTAWTLTCSLPYWPINPALSRSVWYSFQLDLARCTWAILPATILWGASFPLALAAAARPDQDPGKLVGKVYAANTLGAIVGAVGTSILLIGWAGTRHGHQALIALSGLAACFMFGYALIRQKAGRPVAALLLATVAAGPLLVWSVPPVPWELVAFGRYLPTYSSDRQLLYVGEGRNASVAVTETFDGIRNFHVSGKVEASTDALDMRLQRMLGHLSAMLHPKPRSVLVVGCGAGVTAGSFLVHPEVERVVICEIEPLIPSAITPYFSDQNHDVVNDPRVEVVYDDARHYILTTKEKFDVITSDPIHPWVKGAATLYTREYFELCRRRLNPGGLISQWVPLYESSEAVVRSELGTFFSVFPNGTLWGNAEAGAGYDTVGIGRPGPAQDQH